MSPRFFNVYMDAVMKELKMGMGRRGVRFLEEGREWKLPGLLYADDLVLEKQVRTRKMEEAVLEDELFYKRKDEK